MLARRYGKKSWSHIKTANRRPWLAARRVVGCRRCLCAPQFFVRVCACVRVCVCVCVCVCVHFCLERAWQLRSISRPQSMRCCLVRMKKPQLSAVWSRKHKWSVCDWFWCMCGLVFVFVRVYDVQLCACARLKTITCVIKTSHIYWERNICV